MPGLNHVLRFGAMQKVLNETEVRVLGSLVEKQLTTPEYYPLTLNALTNACNQKSNRDPVVSFNEPTVTQAIESLREKNLVYVFYGSTSRVPKYKHMMPEVLRLDEREVALLCVLMLRAMPSRPPSPSPSTPAACSGWSTGSRN